MKRLYKLTTHAIQGFWNEVNLIAVLQHTNLVRLIGFVDDPDTKILVYEYLPRSSLNTYIYSTGLFSLFFQYQKKRRRNDLILVCDAQTQPGAMCLIGTNVWTSPRELLEGYYIFTKTLGLGSFTLTSNLATSCFVTK